VPFRQDGCRPNSFSKKYFIAPQPVVKNALAANNPVFRKPAILVLFYGLPPTNPSPGRPQRSAPAASVRPFAFPRMLPSVQPQPKSMAVSKPGRRSWIATTHPAAKWVLFAPPSPRGPRRLWENPRNITFITMNERLQTRVARATGPYRPATRRTERVRRSICQRTPFVIGASSFNLRHSSFPN